MAMNKQRRSSNISNIFSYDDAGNIVIKDYGQVTRYSWNGLIHGFVGPLSISSVSAATTDTDRFLVSDGGVLKYRTGVELLSDIGGVPSTRTLTINGVTQDLSADRTFTIAAGISGSGADGQVAYWNGTNSQTGSNTLTYTPTTSLIVNNSVTAASAIARGTNLTPTLTASANNDVLVGLEVTPNFTNGAFTGVKNYGLRSKGDVLLQLPTSAANEGFKLEYALDNTLGGTYASKLTSLAPGVAYRDLFFLSRAVLFQHLGYINSLFISSAGNIIVNSTTDGGQRLQVYGDAFIKGSGATSATSALLIQNSAGGRTLEVLNNGRLIVDDTAGTQTLQINGTAQSQGIAIGTANTFATANGSGAVAIGRAASAAGGQSVAIGIQSSSAGEFGVAIGYLSVASSQRGIAIGFQASTAGWTNSIAFNGQATGTGQFVAGGAGTITDVFFGSGPRTFNTNGTSYTINGSGGATSIGNTNGGNITIAGGKGVGSGASGDVIISTATPTTSGSTLQTLTERIKVFGATGNVVLQNGGTFLDGGFRLDVNGTARVSGAMTVSGLITAPSGLFASGVLDIYSDGSNGAIAMRTLANTLCLRKYVKVLGDDGGFGNNNASAAFQIDGTNRGFLPPRMTTTQKNAIATPAAGLVVYDNTDNYLSLHNGTNWQNIVSPNSAGNVLIGVNTDLGYKLQLSSAIYTTNGGINSDLNNTINHALYAVNQSLTSAASNGIVYLETTWNTTGNPSAIYLNVTNTASGSFSKLLDLRVGLTPVFQVDKSGGVFTGQPIGGSNGVWKFGQYNATAPSATGYVEVEVNGTLYKLLAST